MPDTATPDEGFGIPLVVVFAERKDKVEIINRLTAYKQLVIDAWADPDRETAPKKLFLPVYEDMNDPRVPELQILQESNFD